MSYRALFAPRGAVGFALAAVVARFPMGMGSLAAALMVTGAHRSYSLAGIGGAVTLGAVAVVGPWQARLVDRLGQRRVGVPAAVVSAAGGAGVVAALYGHAPVWLFLLACAVMGLGPNTGSLSRARWSRLHAGDAPTLHTAFAYEGVVDELCYVLGPLATIVIASRCSALAAFLTTVLLGLGGMLALAAQRRTEPPPAIAAAGGRPGASAFRERGMPALVLMLVALGGVFGAMELTTVGFAAAHGQRSAAGVVLSCYALGSCLSGLAFGFWRPRGAPVVRLRLALLAMALTLAPLPLAAAPWQAAAMLLVAGLATAPTVATCMGLVRDLVPAARLTEGFTWTTTGLLVGISAGTAGAGWLADHAAPGAGYHLPAVAALLALVLSFRLSVRETAGGSGSVQ